ncbi:SH3 domain-containing protein [Myxococcus sp. CA033]|uniref:SH3 domain-containing protein n=1 Tax=Myxococcus sp. CA033 TaxID=2741516 RepID=UPI00157B43CD|nr:SH3 domain-containing protein [Myxococcus sp. CA033]NTX34438.1 SH3 domain-containing protein [Myxococcus sp. CA033]
MTDAIRRSLGPVIRTVGNVAIEKTVPPPLQQVAKAAMNFAVSSFEQARPARAQVSLEVPPPPVTNASVQGNDRLEVGDKLQVESGIGVNLRERPLASSRDLGGFRNGERLEVIAPPQGSPEQAGFVYVRGPDGSTGWVSTSFTRELTEAEAAQAPVAVGTPSDENTAASAEYQDVYVDQFGAEGDVGGDGENANCGPSATLTALRNEGLEIPPIPDLVTTHGQDTTGAEVQAVRYWGNHENDSGDDGVSTNDQGEVVYALGENGSYTGTTDIEHAVTAAGGTFYRPAANPGAIADAIRDGSTVVISGSFYEYSTATDLTPEALRAPEGRVYVDDNGDFLPDETAPGEYTLATEKKKDTWTQGGGAIEHFVAVVGVTDEGNFIVCDPAHPSKAPIEVSPEKLDAFMRGNRSAIAIDGPTTEAS